MDISYNFLLKRFLKIFQKYPVLVDKKLKFQYTVLKEGLLRKST